MSRRGSAAHNVLELPESAGHRLRRRVLIWSGAVLGVILALMLVLLYSPLLAIKQVQFDGNSLAPDAEVQQALEPLVGTPLPQVGPGKVLGMLSGQAAVKDVVVQADAPSTLRVTVVEHEPVAVVKDGKRFALVAADGRKLATVAKRADAKLPLIAAEALDKDPQVFSTITSVLASLPTDVLGRLRHAEAETIDSVKLTLEDGRTVLWGNAERSAHKARVLEALLGIDDRKDPVKEYDVTSPEQPVTR